VTLQETYLPVEGPLRDWLRAYAPTTALGPLLGAGGHGFYVGMPGSPAASWWPLVTLQRVGGSPEGGDSPVDLPLIQFDVWGTADQGGRDRGGRERAAATLLAVILTAAKTGPVLPGGGKVRGATCTLGPLWRPDPDTNQPRYEVDVQFTVAPA
jgi:hypothetical protein